MVDSTSAEARRKELLDESLGCIYPEDVASIKQRYKDTSLVLFKDQLSLQEADNRSFLSFGTRRSSTVSEYGNTPIIVRKSRSANGKLSKVGEQWPSLRGKASLSNYTLLEGKEFGNANDEDYEDTDTEEEGDSKASRPSKEVAASKKEDDVKREITDLGDEAAGSDKPNGAKEKDAGVWENNENEVAGNRKSFSHYDLQLQRNKRFIDEEIKDDDDDDGTDGYNEDDKDAISMRTVLEVEGVDHKIVLVRSNSSRKDQSSTDASETVGALPTPNNKEIYPVPHESNADKSVLESCTKNPTNISGPLDIHHNSARENFVKNSQVDSDHHDRSSTDINSKSCHQQSSDDWSNVELRIVEPQDLAVSGSDSSESKTKTTETSNALTSRLLSTGGNDDDDVVFIDEVSPSTNQNTVYVTSEVDTDKIVTPNAPHLTPLECKPVLSSEPAPFVERLSVENGTAKEEKEELNKSLEVESQNGLLALPVRSPTPPKRSPRRSPRVPKSKDKGHERHSSLDLPSNANQQPSTSKDVTPASPALRNKDTNRILNFSLRKERSKSASSLSSKKNREKEKVVRVGSDDQGSTKNSNAPDLDDVKCESSGKRVGVRSMMIDGTIKRNFIIIHPSDESETIGLAPLSSFTNETKNSAKASKALSSVRSHITGVTITKKEVVKQKTSKSGMTKECRRPSMESRGDGEVPSADGYPGGSLRGKKKNVKKQLESQMHGSSISLTSTVSHVNSRVIVGSPVQLSEVDCDSLNVSTQGILSNSSKTTSRLCVLM